MSPRDIEGYVEAQQQAEEAKYKRNACLFDFAAIKIIAGRHFKNPKNISLHDYFPSLFRANGNPTIPWNEPSEYKEKIAVNTWKRFLGV